MEGRPGSRSAWPQTALRGRASALVIDGDGGGRRYVERILKRGGFAVVGFADLQAARQALDNVAYDIVVLSLDSHQAGWAATLRAVRSAGPVLLLLQSAGPNAVARMLNAGVDDCLSAPFDASDLAARAQRILRLGCRRRGLGPPGGLGRLRFDLARLRVRIGSLEIRLSRLEYRTLWVLAQGNGAVLRFRDIETRVWGDTGRPQRQALRRVVHKLRHKLCGSRGAGTLALKAAPRVGYRLDVAGLSADS